MDLAGGDRFLAPLFKRESAGGLQSTGQEDHHLFTIAQTVHPLERLGAGFLETVRFLVRRLHRRRTVEDEHAQSAFAGVALEERPAERKDHQGQHQELEEEQPVFPETLEGRVGLRLGEKFLPEQRARNQLHHPLALEQVKDDDDRQRQREDEGSRRKKVHAGNWTPRAARSSEGRSTVESNTNAE